jgi:dTDP-glucose pyrophosphorylase/predicted transcriptional regulator
MFEKYIINANSSILYALSRLEELSNDVLTLFVVDGQRMVGTLTDGDIRRALMGGASLNDSIDRVMHKDFSYIIKNEKDAVQKINSIRGKGIKLLPILDEGGKKIVDILKFNVKKSLLPVDAILMAGGKGIRLRPLTDTVPKPLLKVGDRAIIDHSVDGLVKYGVKNIFVTINYLGEQIEQHFSGVYDQVDIKCIKEEKFLGTIGASKLIKHFCNDNILIMNSDLFTNIDLEDFYLDFLKKGSDFSIAVVPYSVSVPYGIIESEGDDVVGVKEKPIFNYFANGGIYLLKRELLDLIPDSVYTDATEFINLLVNRKKKVSVFPITGYWIDIGKMEDYKKAQYIVNYLSR